MRQAAPPRTARRPAEATGGPALTVRQPPDLEQVERSCDDAFMHFASEGLLSPREDCLITKTLRAIMAEARALHEDDSPARRWWAS